MRKKRKKKLKKDLKNPSILPVLFIIALLSLFSETVRTIPAGALSEKFDDLSYELPKLNSELIEKKLLSNSLSISNKIDTKKLENKIIIKEKTKKIVIAKTPQTELEKINSKIFDQTIVDKEIIVDVQKIEETIEIAADTSASTIIINGEETLIPGSSEKNITYMQILQKPNDLELNLKYAQQQGKIGNYKQTISTLERLNMVYPDNIEIKLLLLSVLVQADSPNKAVSVIDDIKSRRNLSAEDLETVNEIEIDLKERSKPKIWNLYADIGIGAVQNNNVNSVSKTRLQSSSDALIGFNSPKFDKTVSGSLGLTASRSIGEASSFMINVNVTDSEQEEETTDDFEGYGLTLALDTSIGNQNLSPYLMLSKTDYQDDADSFSLMYGMGGYFSVGDRHSLSYGYSFSDSKNNQNSTDNTARDTNAIGYSYSLGHDFMLNEIITTSTGIGYSDSDALNDTNDYETYDFSLRLNFSFPWAYISVGDAVSFNDYKKVDTSINSGRLRSDVTNTLDLMLTKALGDIFPTLDPNRSLYINLAYEKVISESNIINYDYIGDSYSLSFSKSVHLNK